MSNLPTERPNWHESSAAETLPSQEKQHGSLRRICGNIGSIILNPIAKRIDYNAEFYISLPNKNSTPDEISEFERKHL